MTRGKKSVLAVTLVAALCAAMLFGATMAWFTRTTTTGTNTIKVAGYNVELKYATSWPGEDGEWADLTSAEQLLFNDTDKALKPGDKTGVKYIKIINNNDYAIKATVDISTIAQAINGSSETVPETEKLKLYASTKATETSDNLTEQSAGEDGKYTLTIDSVDAATTSDSTTTPGTAVIAIQFGLPETAVTPSVSNTFTIEVKTEQKPEGATTNTES